MTMKEGTGSDPFADDDVDDQEGSGTSSDEAPTTETTGTTTNTPSMSSQETQYPYVLRRDTVKDERTNEHVAFLRDEYADLEDEIQKAVAEELDLKQKDVSVTDIREAMVEVASRHPDEMAEVLLEWGYDAK